MGGAKKEKFQGALIRRLADQPLQFDALLTAVSTSKPSGQLDSHQQASGSQNERIGDATDVELSDVAHKR